MTCVSTQGLVLGIVNGYSVCSSGCQVTWTGTTTVAEDSEAHQALSMTSACTCHRKHWHQNCKWISQTNMSSGSFISRHQKIDCYTSIVHAMKSLRKASVAQEEDRRHVVGAWNVKEHSLVTMSTRTGIKKFHSSASLLDMLILLIC